MTIYIPYEQAENAAHRDHTTLLATEVYASLHDFISAAAEVSARVLADENRERSFYKNRTHNAILIDGVRGTGKSSVLVNLRLFLAAKNEALLNSVHIFHPVDPTLLEDHDDLFLNVIVAAVLADQEVMNAQMKNTEGRQALQKQLQSLGHALESMQSQREKQGLDKIRSFIGNQQLIEEVHGFFRAVTKLLHRDLLVLTIDDVDTSLHHAFENMEVIRRYLVSPYILPIISGDLSLYQDVTWREFHGGLLKDSSYRRHEAYERARSLADEYHRKILPMQYRLTMPAVPLYFKNPDIVIGAAGKNNNLGLPVFHAWVEALLNGPINGLENSQLEIPVKVVRALAQIIHRLKTLIPPLAVVVEKEHLTKNNIRRRWLVPNVSDDRLEVFKKTYRLGADNEGAYQEFGKTGVPPANAGDNLPTPSELPGLALNWQNAMLQHFRTDPQAGAAFLVCEAQAFWNNLMKSEQEKRSVFDTGLFKPLAQSVGHYSLFERNADLGDWQEKLGGRAPKDWLERLPKTAIVPYPVPEAGTAVPNATYRVTTGANISKVNLLIDLVLQKNFYSSNKRAPLTCTGRIFELVITSLIRDVSENDIAALLQRAPFYSFGAIAGTKPLTIGGEDANDDDFIDSDTDVYTDAIALLAQQIAAWRDKFKLSEFRLSPWLVYNVFNKTINQAWLFNKPLNQNQQPLTTDGESIAWIARQAFNSLWAAFGSFEKGALYGLPEVVAYVNIGPGKTFENSDLYRQNIAPFMARTGADSTFGEAVGASTFMLSEHPLRQWVDLIDPPTKNAPRRVEKADVTAAREWIKTALELPRFPNSSKAEAIRSSLRGRFEDSAAAQTWLTYFETLFPAHETLRAFLQDAITLAFAAEA